MAREEQDPLEQARQARHIRAENRLREKEERYIRTIIDIDRHITTHNADALLAPNFAGLTALGYLMTNPPESEVEVAALGDEEGVGEEEDSQLHRDHLNRAKRILEIFRRSGKMLYGIFDSPNQNRLSPLRAAAHYGRYRFAPVLLELACSSKVVLNAYQLYEMACVVKDCHDTVNFTDYHLFSLFKKQLPIEQAFSRSLQYLASSTNKLTAFKAGVVFSYMRHILTRGAPLRLYFSLLQKSLVDYECFSNFHELHLKIIMANIGFCIISSSHIESELETWLAIEHSLSLGTKNKSILMAAILSANKASPKERVKLLVRLAKKWPESFAIVLQSEPLCESFHQLRSCSTEEQDLVLNAIKSIPYAYISNPLDTLEMMHKPLKKSPPKICYYIAEHIIGQHHDIQKLHQSVNKSPNSPYLSELRIHLLQIRLTYSKNQQLNSDEITALLGIFSYGSVDQCQRAFNLLQMNYRISFLSHHPDQIISYLSFVNVSNISLQETLKLHAAFGRTQVERYPKLSSMRRDLRPMILVALAHDRLKLPLRSDVNPNHKAWIKNLCDLLDARDEEKSLSQTIDNISQFIQSQKTILTRLLQVDTDELPQEIQNALELLIAACHLQDEFSISASGQSIINKYKSSSVEEEFSHIPENKITESAVLRIASGNIDYSNDIICFLIDRHRETLADVFSSPPGLEYINVLLSRLDLPSSLNVLEKIYQLPEQLLASILRLKETDVHAIKGPATPSPSKIGILSSGGGQKDKVSAPKSASPS